jgi:V/A-type H+-transporting ATPase subunit I
MIIPMKKVGIVVEAQEAQNTVSHLRSLGVLHVEHQKMPQGEKIEACRRDVELVDAAIGILSEEIFKKGEGAHALEVEKCALCQEKACPSSSAPALSSEEEKDWDWKVCATHIVDQGKRYAHLKEFSRNLAIKIDYWEKWGDFDPQALQTLCAHGVIVRLYQVSRAEMAQFPAGAIVEVLRTDKDAVCCAVISRSDIAVPFKEVEPPKMRLSMMKERFAEDSCIIRKLVEDVRSAVFRQESLLRQKKILQKNLEFWNAVGGMGSEGAFAYLVGYVPVDRTDDLLAAARRQSWAVQIDDPSADDLVPTLVRNPRWVSVIQPLMKFLEITPAYTELDTSPVFLIFFSLFFGIIIGDAGYGMLYLILTFFLRRKFGAKIRDKRIFPLMFLLSSCAITWGVLTGTFFGQTWLAGLGVKALVPILNDPVFLQGMCFFIAALHLSLGHAWRFVVQFPASTAWAEAGWINILWAAFFLAKTLLLAAIFPPFGKYMIIVGIALVVFFSNPRKNIFARIGAGLGTIALSIMNSFGDVISYVRLFAVGLAGVAISDAFNSMVSGVAAGGVFGLIAAGLILVAGHLLNFALSPMSVLVHGVRLNVLEFSGHAGVTWSGVRYEPLSEE